MKASFASDSSGTICLFHLLGGQQEASKMGRVEKKIVGKLTFPLKSVEKHTEEEDFLILKGHIKSLPMR